MQWGKDSLFNKQCWENWTATCKKAEIRTFPSAIHKDKLKTDKRPKCKTRNYKTLRGKHRQTLDDINKKSKIFCDPPPRVTEIKTNVNKWLN